MNAPLLKPLDRALLLIVRYGLFSVFILPFVVVLSYLYPWVSGKIWAFQIIIELLFPLWVFLAMRRKEYRPASTSFTYALLAYFAVITLSGLFGDDLHRSMWSKPDRLTGLFFHYHLMAFFLMAGSVWRGIVREPIMATVGAATVVALHGLFQTVTGVGSASTDRASASLGNPSYFAQYLVPHLFLAAWLFWEDRHRLRRALWIGSSMFMIFGILVSKSRGAVVGLFVTAVAAAVVFAWKGQGRLKRWARWGVVACFAVVLLFLAADKWPPTHEMLYRQRLSIQYLRETTGPRTLLLKNVIKGIQDRPLLGWGPENFESAYYFHYDPVTIQYSDYETRQDRPHNLILDILVNFGVAGFLAYAALFFFAWRTAMRSGADRWFQGGVLILANVGHLATNLFIFETPISYISLYTQLAFIAAMSMAGTEAGEDEETAQGAGPAALAAAALALWALWYGVLGTIGAARHTAAMIIDLQNEKPNPELLAAEAEALKKSRTPFLERDIRAVVSNMSNLTGEPVKGGYEPTLRSLIAEQIAVAPKREHDYVFNLVNAVALQSIDPKSPEEQAALEQAVARIHALAPDRQEVAWITANMLLAKGDAAGAEAELKKAIDLYPAATVSHARYAAFLLRAGRYEEAMMELKDRWADIRPDPVSATLVNREVVRLFDGQRFSDLEALYRASLKVGARAFEWDATGAISAALRGDKAESERIIAAMRIEYPDKKDIIDQLTAQLSAPQPAPAPVTAP